MKRIVLAAALAAACGGAKQGTAVDHNSAGSGSSTLLVTADATVTNAATAPSSSFQVDLRDGLNAVVSGATVTVQGSGLGDVALTETATGSGRYTGSKPSLPAGDLSLAVTRATDRVQGVVVGYPGAHAVNAPALNAMVAANQPLDISWTTPATAKSATVATRNFTVQVPDTGAYTIPAANNPVRTGQRLILSRINEVEVAGGLPGSRLRVTVTTTVDPFTVQ